jgi:hypothetical protein
MKINRSLAYLMLVLLFVVGRGGMAQGPCALGDDGFNIGCCQVVTPNLPTFPTITIDGTYGCIRDCNLEAQYGTQVSIGFQWIFCDYGFININVAPTTTCGPAFGGALLAKYSRTWRRVSATGLSEQVWRFLINGDLQYVLTTACPSIPCPVPPQVALGLPVHMVGSIDYICNPIGAAGYRIEMNLNHLPGCISHAPFSTFPLAGPAAHFDRSYHLVAPSNFAFMPVPEPVGGMAFEAVRPSRLPWPPTNYQCLSEAPIIQGAINTLANLCPCSATPISSALWADQRLIGTVACNGVTSTFASTPIPGYSAGGLLTMRLGRYLPTAVNPGGNEVCIHWGLLRYTDPCTQTGPFHVVTGVSTSDPAAPGQLFPVPGTPVAPPQRVFMDLCNVLILPVYPPATPFPVPVIGWGSLFASDLVFNLNLP